MNEEYLAEARKVVKDPRLLIIGASRRATQLAKPGTRRLVSVKPNDTYLDIALKEIAEGKVIISCEEEE